MKFINKPVLLISKCKYLFLYFNCRYGLCQA